MRAPKVTFSLSAICAGFAPLCAHAFIGDAPLASAPHWQSVWFDDFDGDGLDRSKWAAEESCWGGGNNERQCYVDRPENIEVSAGVLRLKAASGAYTGPLHADRAQSVRGAQRTQPFTSGKVTSLGKAGWKYGRVSARMKLPAGQGTWPAFWMMPVESHYGGWPLSGEIDIMEAVNLATPCEQCVGGRESRTSGAIHFGGTAPDNTFLTAYAPESASSGPAAEWRVYSVEWAQGVIQWFVDGRLFMRVNQDDWHTEAVREAENPKAPFDRPFYVILNLAVGGSLPEKSNGAGVDEAAFPASLLVDWVRVEQCEGDLETGRACLSKQNWNGEVMTPSDVVAP